jgi:hypothetical protein
MAAKEPTKKRKASLDTVLSTVERGFAAVAGDIADIKSTMATKADISRLDTKIDSVESNLSGQINRIDTKLTKFEEHEIDKRLQLEVRVTTIPPTNPAPSLLTDIIEGYPLWLFVTCLQ